ncbi:MAG: class I SAM-dependent methyltransferase [Streptosporangiaceae bacterium]
MSHHQHGDTQHGDTQHGHTEHGHTEHGNSQRGHAQHSDVQHSDVQRGHAQHGHGAAGQADVAAMAELIDLDAEVLHGYLSDVMAWVGELAAGQPRRRILDVGSGTGTGALTLARRFEAADVTAVDVSASMLGRLGDKARDLGVAGRVRTVEADLDGAWPDVGRVDLAWASASLHHMANPDRVLGDIFGALNPGGLLVLAELEGFPRFLPDDVELGRPGLEARGRAALAEELPYLGSDWGPRLRQAGFAIVGERHFAIELKPPLPAAAGRYAQACLRRLRSRLDARMDAEDLAALDTLIDSDGPDGVLRRGDLTVWAERDVWVGSRP